MDIMLVDVQGYTYPHRAELRAMGARWNKLRKVWQIDSVLAEEAHALVNGRRRRQSVVHFYSPSSGAVVYRNARGLCEDAPCCGCCTG